MCPEYESNAQSFHIMHFPPIETHYKEKFNVSGLLNEDSDMKKNYKTITRLLLKGFPYVLYFVYFIHTQQNHWCKIFRDGVKLTVLTLF